jgi:hypothetical protein
VLLLCTQGTYHYVVERIAHKMHFHRALVAKIGELHARSLFSHKIIRLFGKLALHFQPQPHPKGCISATKYRHSNRKKTHATDSTGFK